MKKNPFKFGSVVEGNYFTNRIDEIKKVESILRSRNHLIIISPRRFGKTSLISKVLKSIKRPAIFLDLQIVTNQEDMASQILKRLYRVYPFEKLKQMLRNFRIVPNISLNPVSNEVDIHFQPSSAGTMLIEDLFNLLERISIKKKELIVVLDEFQEIKNIGKDLDRRLRSIIQHHQNINYVFMGSQESIMKEMFEKKKSPFYHFGYLLRLDKIPEKEFTDFLSAGLKMVTTEYSLISNAILNITASHPYYTQQLAFYVWELLNNLPQNQKPVEEAVSEIIRQHDMDYERLWNTLNRTDMKNLIGLSVSGISPLSMEFSNKFFTGASSTVFSSLKRLMMSGLVIKTSSGYEIDDPFFKRWIIQRRER